MKALFQILLYTSYINIIFLLMQRGDVMEEFKRELDFGLDNFQQQKVLSGKQSVAKVLLNLLMMRPGNMPSLPHIGVNIKEYMYRLENDINPEELKEKIYNQCSELIPYLVLGEVKVFVANYKGQGVLIINIPILDEGKNESIIYGFSKDQSGDMIFNVEFENEIINKI